MICEMVPYKKEHLLDMIYEPHNDSEREFFLGGGIYQKLEGMDSKTILLNGKPAVCLGIIPYWEGRGQVWSMFSAKCKSNFVPVFRLGKKFFQDQPLTRIEICVPCGFDIGKRRAILLGFKLECSRARKYLRDGTDCALFSLVKEGA